MVIHVQMVPEDHPLSVSFVIPAEIMNATEGYRALPYLFEEPVKCECKIRKIQEDIEVQAKLVAKLGPVCDLCLTPYALELSRDEYFTCQPFTSHDPVDEEGDVYFYHGRNLDLSPMIREIILLDLPMQYKCSEGCQGLCGHCGMALEDGFCAGCQKSKVFAQKISQL